MTVYEITVATRGAATYQVAANSPEEAIAAYRRGESKCTEEVMTEWAEPAVDDVVLVDTDGEEPA